MSSHNNDLPIKTKRGRVSVYPTFSYTTNGVISCMGFNVRLIFQARQITRLENNSQHEHTQRYA